ncbi:MAG TPA: hypothetical protein VGJ91_13880, partial [Polyangiaceae bacterium]
MLWLSWGSPALAHTVVLLRPPNHSPATIELLERLRGELLSVGFEVMVRDRPESNGAALSEPLQRMLAREEPCDAAVDLVGEAVPVAVDVWIVDGARSFQLLARVKVDAKTENSSKDSAIRASEVLRARLFETHTDNHQQRQSSAPPSSRVETSEAQSRESRQSSSLGFELGAVALASLDGVGPALLPLVRLDWAIDPKLVLEASLAGFGTRPSIATTAGSAQVAAQYALLGAC